MDEDLRGPNLADGCHWDQMPFGKISKGCPDPRRRRRRRSVFALLPKRITEDAVITTRATTAFPTMTVPPSWSVGKLVMAPAAPRWL
ncbi:hypothetical protein B5K06_08770 [Rhizobium grahamii]|uniref:Uncharacterized protein n=1 Tax=Rhizobium grahamii TaxID=1120045 RepID=A0A370KSJ6_9HYPH|nr:hypothetical protein B5K06_08770 [Rhizobium grahamii]